MIFISLLDSVNQTFMFRKKIESSGKKALMKLFQHYYGMTVFQVNKPMRYCSEKTKFIITICVISSGYISNHILIIPLLVKMFIFEKKKRESWS